MLTADGLNALANYPYLSVLRKWNVNSVVIPRPINTAKCLTVINDTFALCANKPLIPFITINTSAQKKSKKCFKLIAKEVACEELAGLPN